MMRVNRRSAALATFAGNGLTVAITLAQAFLLIPVCLAYLGPGLYAAWLAASEVLIWLQMLDGGLPNLLMQRVGALVGRSEWDLAARWSSTVLAGLFLASLVLCGAAVGLAPLVVDWLGVSGAERETFVACFRVGALASVALMLSNGCVGLARGVQRTGIINVSQVSGAAVGLVVSISLLLAGWGLWSLALGLASRAAVALGGAIWFLNRLPDTAAGWVSAPSRAVARDVGHLLPYTATSTVAYVLASNSEILLVTSVLGPLPALAYALTRRAFDGVKALLDTIAWAVSGGFAHLVTAGDRSRSRTVLREILWLRLGLASLAVALVVAVNDAFVTLLFGPGQYAGLALTVAFALQVMLNGQSFLVNYLWRATGHVREGSMLLGVEALARVLGMAVGLQVVGMVGAPVAASLVSAVALVLVHRRLDASLPDGPDEPVGSRVVWVPVIVLALAMFAGVAPAPATWMAVATTLGVVGTLGGSLLWWSLPPGSRLKTW
jgi:O-antigen/teichoic acid export membrane protein